MYGTADKRSFVASVPVRTEPDQRLTAPSQGSQERPPENGIFFCPRATSAPQLTGAVADELGPYSPALLTGFGR